MSALWWFLLGLLVTAGPPAMGLLLDELEWWSLKREAKRQSRLAKPFQGNASQIFKTQVGS